ncbi:MAG: V-type ATP synthase subunit A, partial [Anaerolineales bacterium]
IPLGTGEESSRIGSVSVVGAVSPPAGDFSEPITQNSMRLTGTFWALDTDLARRRHFPAIDWNQSFSLYELDEWFRQEADPEWPDLIAWMNSLLEEVDRLEEIVRLIGPEALSNDEQLTLFTGRMTREDFMQQLATSRVDAFSPLPKTILMLKILRRFDEVVEAAREQGYSADEIQELDLVSKIAHMKQHPPEQAEQALEGLLSEVNRKRDELTGDR